MLAQLNDMFNNDLTETNNANKTGGNMNRLELMVSGNEKSWVAIFSGVTDSGEHVRDEEAGDIFASSKEDLIRQALSVWGADRENTNIQWLDEWSA